MELFYKNHTKRQKKTMAAIPLSRKSQLTSISINSNNYNSQKWEYSAVHRNPPNTKLEYGNASTEYNTTICRLLPTRHRHPLIDWSYPEHIPHILEGIQNGNCAVVTDGSFFESTSQSAAAFVIGNKAAHRRIVGRCFIAGLTVAYSTYRAELAGIHAGLLLILGLCETYNVEKGRIILGCNNNGAIKRIQTGQIKLQYKHFDFLSAIITIINKLPITVNLTHVDGHKDEVMALENLSILESMNVQADIHAKVKAAINLPSTFHTEAEIAHEWAPVKVRNEYGIQTKIYSSFDKDLYNRLTTFTSRNYWANEMKVTPQTASEINWKSLGDAFSGLPPNKKTAVLKWNSGFCATNQMLFRRKQSTSAACPGCDHPIETTEHIFTCKSTGATKEWNIALKALENWMINSNGAPELVTAVIANLRAWRDNESPPRTNYNLPLLSTAVEKQNELGWKAFVHGFVAQEWEQSQALYLQFLGQKISGRRWIAALIRKLWETIWAMWRFRNSLVHDQTNTPLKKVNAMLNVTMMKELQYGLNGLLLKYGYLFRKKLTEVIKTSINKKNSGSLQYG